MWRVDRVDRVERRVGPGGPDEAKYEVRNHSVTTRGHPSPQRTHLNGKNQSL